MGSSFLDVGISSIILNFYIFASLDISLPLFIERQNKEF